MLQGEKLTEEGPERMPCIKGDRVELDGMEGKSKVVAPDENRAWELLAYEIGIATENFGIEEGREWDPGARNWKIEKFIEETLKIGSGKLKKEVARAKVQLGNDRKEVEDAEMNLSLETGKAKVDVKDGYMNNKQVVNGIAGIAPKADFMEELGTVGESTRGTKDDETDIVEKIGINEEAVVVGWTEGDEKVLEMQHGGGYQRYQGG